MEYNKPYELLDPVDGQENLQIRITEGPYTGVVYQYGTVQFDVRNENTPEEEGYLNFDIITSDDSNKTLVESPDFVDMAGNILISILEESLASGDYRIGNSDTDSEESITE